MTKYPYRGWNSFDAYNWSITEKEMIANTDVLDKYFKPFGYEYVVLDFIWSLSGGDTNANPMQDSEMNPQLNMDIFGRLRPAPDRFPTSIMGSSLKYLSDYIHGKGMKMGLHLMRGIPRQAVLLKTPIKGTNYTAADIAITEPSDGCTWLNHMYGIDMKKPGAQEYLNSLFELYAEWGIDLVKVDDLSYPYHGAELEGYRKAIENCGREMVLSTSPGPAPLEQVEHLSKYADMWRISADFWDRWSALDKLYGLFCDWSKCKPEVGFPDGDMVPFSKLSLRGPMGKPRYSCFTHDEKIFLMSLWCINNSPLMLGGDLTVIDEDARAILTNPSVLAMQRFASHAKRCEEPLAEMTELWTASDSTSPLIKYCAIFNRGEGMSVADVDLKAHFGTDACIVKDLWSDAETEAVGNLRTVLRPHSAKLYMIIPKN